MGLHRAGFEVVGVDIKQQPRYPFRFVRMSWEQAINYWQPGTFDFVWSSPPCQAYSDLGKRNGNADQWPKLVEPVREALKSMGIPYVIENVEGAPLINPVRLCGTQFPGLRVIRHRLFESNFPIADLPHGEHPICHTFDKRKRQFGTTDEMRDFVTVTGGGNCTLKAAKDAMGIDWMTKEEINEAIPPAYSEYIARQFFKYAARAA